VVLLHEAWGIDDVLRRHAERLASAGYLVYAPDLLGEGPWLRCIVSTFRA
jgi:carboxymethylenebutenolidase